MTVRLENDQIKTDLYVKPTDTHQYLRMDSCHPMHCKASIPYSQALRLRRICSEEQDLKNSARELKQHLLSRGYNEQHLNIQIQRALNTSRAACLQPKQSQKKSSPRSFGGHLPSTFTCLSYDHQPPSDISRSFRLQNELRRALGV